MRRLHIVLGILAAFAAAVLFATYGTTLPSAPFMPIQINGLSSADSEGSQTVVADSESRRALILNADNDLTGVVDCTTADTPIDAITDVCTSDGYVYLSGIRFKPDSDIIEQERVVVYDKGGNFQGAVLEVPGTNTVIPSIKSLSDTSNGVVVAYEKRTDSNTLAADSIMQDVELGFIFVDDDGMNEVDRTITSKEAVHSAAFSTGSKDHCATLNFRGILSVDLFGAEQQVYVGHALTAIDIGDDGTLYACDDETGSLCIVDTDSKTVSELMEGNGFRCIHENNGMITLCDDESDTVTICDHSGAVMKSFSQVTPSIGFSARMTIVWASALYLVALAVVLAIRKTRQLIAAGKTTDIGPILLAVAVVSAVAIAIGSLSFSAYQSSLDMRAREINAYADYLEDCAFDLSEAMDRANNRDALHGDEDQLDNATNDLIAATKPALLLVNAANVNNIGMYYTVYSKDEKGAFYLYGSSFEHVMGTSVHTSGSTGLDAAFELDYPQVGKIQQGRTLRDAAQYRFVQILSTDGERVVGVIEIGSKMRSFESAIIGNLTQRVLALLVMILVVYLAYSELRACGRCLISFRQRRTESPIGSIAELTRPFTLAITMLTSIDSVMTVLIARDLLERAGAGASSPLVALPAIMLGVGMIAGQGLYALAGPRVGLRRLISCGAAAMFVCACLTGLAVLSDSFWFYCVAKLTMAVPFGMLYALGYSLPRLADGDDARARAAGGVKRTDTSAAALGTILGGYAAQALGNAWVYAIVAIACIPIITMALNLLPRKIQPLEKLAQPDQKNGRVLDFVRTPTAPALAFLVVLPATVAAGYASFLFPLYSTDLGLSISDINNIVVMGQLAVYVCIGFIEREESRYGKRRVTTGAMALLGVTFLLFAIKTTLAWSVAVIAIVAVLGKSTDGWKAMWIGSAGEAGVPAGSATSAMLATRSLTLIAQPFILGALLGAADFVAVIVIGALCLACAGAFHLIMRRR